MRRGKRGLGPDFRTLFTANIASSLGDGIARTAIPLLAARITDDALLIAGVAALAMLPWLLLAIPSGILIDRVDRRIALAVSQAVRVALAVLLCVLVANGGLTIWWIYLIIFVYGAFETVYDGAVRAVAPSIVVRADLPRANSRIEAAELVVQNFAAGPLTSMLFAVAVLIPLGINVAAFAIAGGLALLLPRVASGRQHAVSGAPKIAWYRQFVDGYRFIRSNRMLMPLWFLSTAIGLCYSFATSSFVLFTLITLKVPEAWFGVFMLSGAVGGLIASALTAGLAARFGAGTTMAVANILSVVSILLVGVFPNVWAVAVLFAISSGTVTTWNILVMSLRQAVIPGGLRGRVHGTWRTLLWGAMPVGSMLGGLVGRIDLALPYLIGGGVATLIAIGSYRFLSRLPDAGDVPDPDLVPAATS